MLKVNYKTNDPLVIREVFSPFLVGDGVSTSPEGSPASFDCYFITEELSLMRNAVSHLVASWKTVGRILLTLSHKGAAYHVSGRRIQPDESALEANVFLPDVEFSMAVEEKVETVSLTVDVNKFQNLYFDLTGRDMQKDFAAGFVKFTDREARRCCLNIVSSVMRSIEEESLELDDDEKNALVNEILENYILSVEPVSEHVIDATRSERVALKALDYLVSEPHQIITMKDLCAEMGSPARTIQQGFKVLYGMGPIEFHRSFRLHKVRERIKQGRAEQKNILSLALDYGFDHPSRFSKLYKSIFGVLPSKDC